MDLALDSCAKGILILTPESWRFVHVQELQTRKFKFSHMYWVPLIPLINEAFRDMPPAWGFEAIGVSGTSHHYAARAS